MPITLNELVAEPYTTEQDLIVRAKQEWQRSIDTLDQMIFLVDESGKIVRANKALEQFGLGKVTNVCGQSILELLSRLGDSPESILGSTLPQARYRADIDRTSTDHYGRFPVFAELDKRWQTIHAQRNSEWMITDRLHKRDFLVTTHVCLLHPTSQDNETDHTVVMVEDITAKKTAERLFIDHQEKLEQDLGEKAVQLEEINQRLKELSKALIQTQEKERKRVATELHDGIGQILSAMKLGIDNILLQSEPDIQCSKDQLKHVQGKIRDALDEVRRICMDLRPPMLDDLGIQATLQWFFREYQQLLHGIEVHFNIDIDEDAMTTSMKTVIFRITQEALNNVAKYAHASRVHFRLTGINNQICLNIKDNGQGFSKNRSDDMRYGFGLNNMRDRALISGGKLEIQSTAGAGVEINATWPLAK